MDWPPAYFEYNLLEAAAFSFIKLNQNEFINYTESRREIGVFNKVRLHTCGNQQIKTFRRIRQWTQRLYGGGG